VTNQYAGIAPDDASFEPYLAMAEELDIPVAYHVTAALPNAPYTGSRKYRARLGDPFLLEEVLVRHPKLRFYVMHAAHPLTDAMIAMMISHPQVYVDTGAISWALPRAEFYYHLRRFVEAGLGRRIMFGSDHMQWPDAIRVAIKSIESAPFLTPEQKRDILFHNANQFFRLGLPEALDVRRKNP
jgi:predicted TIM-barrel fold metal-dependent hydrolase